MNHAQWQWMDKHILWPSLVRIRVSIGIVLTYANNSVKNTQDTIKTHLLEFPRFRLLQISLRCCYFIADNHARNNNVASTRLTATETFYNMTRSFVRCLYVTPTNYRRCNHQMNEPANQAFKRLLPADNMYTARNNARGTGFLPGHSKTFTAFYNYTDKLLALLSSVRQNSI